MQTRKICTDWKVPNERLETSKKKVMMQSVQLCSNGSREQELGWTGPEQSSGTSMCCDNIIKSNVISSKLLTAKQVPAYHMDRYFIDYQGETIHNTLWLVSQNPVKPRVIICHYASYSNKSQNSFQT